MESRPPLSEGLGENFAWIYQERGLGICGVLATFSRAAPFAGSELWVKGEVRYLSMRPIAWREMVAFTGFESWIWACVRIAYFF